MSLSSETTTILVIDDTPANLEVMVEQLESAGYRVVVAQEGEEGIQRAEFVCPDLILLDVLMPNIDGFETCRRLKNNEKTQDIPVIFMTALVDSTDKIAAFDAGGVDYITKPFHNQEVIARVNTHISLRAMQQLLEARNQQLNTQLEAMTQQREELEFRATHDLLTGLPNRTLFRDRLDHAIHQASRLGTKLAVFFIDLDKFKLVNDTMGHDAGDQLLIITASRLTGEVRAYDTVARLAGDEFVALVENVRHESELEPVLQRIALSLAEPMLLLEQEYTLTCSMGVSVYPKDGEDADALLKHADIAMYQAKQAGRHTYRFYDDQMQEHLSRRMSLERRLNLALEHNEFVLHYQPQVNLHSGTICGLEALIRWKCPEQGLLSPAQFIPVAEESRLILTIGEWVLDAACAQIKTWLSNKVPVVPIAINLAAEQFMDPGFDQAVARALSGHRIAAKFLELELTETMSMSNPEAAIRMMHRLKDLGVSLAIDDFGIGYSNLSYLKRFPVDKLKIDGTFVAGMTRNIEDRSIVSAVIRLAHSLGVKAVAEGVETQGQARVLAYQRCDMLQGYYFQRALPADEMEVLLSQEKKYDLASLVRTGKGRIVLLVDDDPAAINWLKRLLRREEVELLAVQDTGEAYEIMARQEIGVVVSDFRMPNEDGIRFLSTVKQLYPHSIRILITGYMSSTTPEETINQAGAHKYIDKAWDDDRIVAVLNEALRQYEHRSLCWGRSL